MQLVETITRSLCIMVRPLPGKVRLTGDVCAQGPLHLLKSAGALDEVNLVFEQLEGLKSRDES